MITPTARGGGLASPLRRRRFARAETVVWLACALCATLAVLIAHDALANPPSKSSGPGGALFGGLGASDDHVAPNMAILLVGTDQDNKLCDTVMVAFINRRTQRIGLLSLPRDLRVELPNGEHCKINAVLGFTMGSGKDIRPGLICLQETVERHLEIKLDGYVRVDVKAFQQIVDYLDGVEVDVPEGPNGDGLHYVDNEQHLNINLQPGRQHLMGYDAMCFVRWRKDARGRGDGDPGRMARQQQFLQAVASRVAAKMGAGKIEATKTALSLARIAHDNTTTNLSLEEIRAVAEMARAVDTAGIDAQSAPVKSAADDEKLGFIFIPDFEGTRAVVREILSEIGRAKPLAKMARIEVLNACGASQIAQKCRAKLTQLDLRVVRSGNLTNEQGDVEFGHDRTNVRCVPQFLQAAQDIKTSLGLPEMVITQDLPETSDVDVQIILGRDFIGKGPNE